MVKKLKNVIVWSAVGLQVVEIRVNEYWLAIDISSSHIMWHVSVMG